MRKLVEDIIYTLPVYIIRNDDYYKMIDFLNKLVEIVAEDIEIVTCKLTPFYVDIHGTYEIYHQALDLKLVNAPMFEKYIYSIFRKKPNDINPKLLHLHTTCFIEAIPPNKFINVSSIIQWINYVIDSNSEDDDMLKHIEKYFNDKCLDINKLYFELLVDKEEICLKD